MKKKKGWGVEEEKNLSCGMVKENLKTPQGMTQIKQLKYSIDYFETGKIYADYIWNKQGKCQCKNILIVLDSESQKIWGNKFVLLNMQAGT